MVDAFEAAVKLQRIVLSWDYWAMNRRQQEGRGAMDSLQAVPSKFKSIKEYMSVFEPLLLEECCAQILRGVEEGEVLSPHPCVCSRCEPKDDFYCARLVLQRSECELYGDNDLVLLCKHNPQDEEAPEDAQSAALWELHALGLCEGGEGEQSLRVKFRLTDDSQAGNDAGVARVRAMRAGLETPESCWWLLKLSSMSTLMREWVALQHAHCCPFIDILLDCKPRSAHESSHLDIPPGMSTTMEAQCNQSQMDALRAGLDGSPLVLIQGPPGTGKTRTILNLLSVIMHSAAKNAVSILKSARPVQAVAGHAQNGSLNLEQRQSLWHKQSPWVIGEPNPRDSVTPYSEDELSTANDCWGLLSCAAPLKLGKNSGPKAHVLVCAPSNSALDEIVLRIMKHGLMDKDGNMYTPSLVRIGRNAHHSVQPVCLDSIVDARLGDTNGSGGKSAGALSHRIERDRLRLAILEEASVVCSTLSFAGHSVFQRLTKKFDVVVIDEAAQAVEPSTLVPITMQGCKQVYLVGDPVQLPATVISTRAVEHNYDCSLFKRLQMGGYPIRMLNTQYRMHPDIAAFPSQQFYSGNLLNGESVLTDTIKMWQDIKCFGPLAFFDVAGKESVPPNNASIQNVSEANMVLCLYRELVHRYPVLRHTASVAVISPYKAQVKLIRDSLKTCLGNDNAKLIDVNTIDGFQGREKDIVIFSCVRSLKKGRKSIGFVADERRINVGLTRARCSLLVVGNARALQASPHWASLILHTLQHNCLYRPKAPFADWVSEAAAGRAECVAASAVELAALEQARRTLASSGDTAGQNVATRCAVLAEELHESDLHAEDEGEVAMSALARTTTINTDDDLANNTKQCQHTNRPSEGPKRELSCKRRRAQ